MVQAIRVEARPGQHQLTMPLSASRMRVLPDQRGRGRHDQERRDQQASGPGPGRGTCGPAGSRTTDPSSSDRIIDTPTIQIVAQSDGQERAVGDDRDVVVEAGERRAPPAGPGSSPGTSSRSSTRNGTWVIRIATIRPGRISFRANFRSARSWPFSSTSGRLRDRRPAP